MIVIRYKPHLIYRNMKKLGTFLLLLCAAAGTQAADVSKVKPVKNIIVMIPDGTSLSTVSLARWHQWYNNPQAPNLNIDPFISGTVRTHSSNAPIGDSAPTTSCYMTGQPTITGFVSTYPWDAGKDNIYPVDSTMAYQPLMTILEAARLKQGKAVGLVVTCEFTHATPADCAAHYYKRGDYDVIGSQMAFNDIDVMFGGGVPLLKQDGKEYLKSNGWEVYLNDIEGFKSADNNRTWALFEERDLPYDIDRDTTKIPSLAQMTDKAINLLSKDKDGFFLKEEGRKVDWAAHANDPVGMSTEFLAFDKACGIALDFAKRNGETAVIILPDHGNSGLSIGSRRCPGYDKLTKDQLFEQFSKYKLTAEGFAKKLEVTPPAQLKALFEEYAGVALTDDELKSIYQLQKYPLSPLAEADRTNKQSLSSFMCEFYTSKTCFGFTTGGHTAEDVFLASYHPQDTRPFGLWNNTDINKYLCALFGMEGQLPQLTSEYFAKHSDVFDGYKYKIIEPKDKDGYPTLEVKGKKKTLLINPYTCIVEQGKNKVKLNTVVVYMDKTNTFYLPKSLRDLLQ